MALLWDGLKVRSTEELKYHIKSTHSWHIAAHKEDENLELTLVR